MSDTDFGVRQLLCWTGGRSLAGARDRVFSGAVIDSRAASSGDLFVAIRGPRHDAHVFLSQVAAAGAHGALVCANAELPRGLPADFALVAVDDTVAGLGALASGHRGRFRGPIVGITGSNGKTTTKEMCAAILLQRDPCLKTEGNLNNEIGLPLTLLRRRPEHASVVVELGMNHRGEIARLTRIARPTIAVITNVGTAHIENLGSREEIAHEKGDIVAGLGPEGVAVLNLDDPRVNAQAARAPGRVVRYGHDRSADVRAGRVSFDGTAWSFKLECSTGSCDVRVPGLSETLVIDALAAAAAALEAGAELEHVQAGLAHFQNVGGRMARRSLPGKIEVIDDTYNANPQSMRAALESLSQLASGGRSVAVLGDMGELGAETERAHREAGRWAAELGIDLLCAVGPHSGIVIEGALEAGMRREQLWADRDGDAERTGRELAKRLQARDWVLVKGSRAMHMENVVAALSRHCQGEAA